DLGVQPRTRPRDRAVPRERWYTGRGAGPPGEPVAPQWAPGVDVPRPRRGAEVPRAAVRNEPRFGGQVTRPCGERMTEDEPFLRAMLANPDDRVARLVYADWLDERSDARGE